MRLVEAIPSKVLIEINKKVGFRLITTAGQKGIINVVKAVPLLGGLIGGTVDAWAIRKVARIARGYFRP
jgi:hypothetical protein